MSSTNQINPPPSSFYNQETEAVFDWICKDPDRLQQARSIVDQVRTHYSSLFKLCDLVAQGLITPGLDQTAGKLLRATLWQYVDWDEVAQAVDRQPSTEPALSVSFASSTGK